MFGIGLSELFIIGIFFICLINPTDYPKIIKKTAKLYRSFITLKNQLLREINLLDIDSK